MFCVTWVNPTKKYTKEYTKEYAKEYASSQRVESHKGYTLCTCFHCVTIASSKHNKN